MVTELQNVCYGEESILVFFQALVLTIKAEGEVYIESE